MAPVVKFVGVIIVVALLVLAVSGGGGVLAADAAAAPAPAPLVARLHLAFARMDDGAVVATTQAAADGEGQQGGGGGWLMECWGAVTELRSCTNEIVLFFLNGESYLGRGCCVAIRTVTHHCWPSMLASVGFTAEEADVLRGFCDAEVSSHTTPPPAAPVAPPAVPAPAPARAST